jgi:glycogen debranching enzyme
MLTISHSTRFLIANDTGEIPTGDECGLYEEDTRCLSEYRLRVDGKALILLSARTIDDDATEHFLVNNEAEGLQQAVLAVVRRRTLGPTLLEELTCTNYGTEQSGWTLDFTFGADFAGVGDVRRAAIQNQDASGRPGGFRSTVEAERGLLRFRYEHDGFRRELEIHLPPDAEIYGRDCRIQLCLEPHETRTLTIEFVPRTGPAIRIVKPLPPPDAAHPGTANRQAAHRGSAQREAAIDDFPANAPKLESDCELLCQAYRQALTDFAALRLHGDAITGDAFVIAGGIPWYLALFGRDSLVASYQALPFAPEAARGILRTLAALQGEKVDDRRGEQPGKIPHEHRFGTITGTQSGIPAYPHYRSIDSTPLFLILLAAYHRLTGDLDLVRELWPHALRALKWIDEYGDRDGDGYLEYPGRHDGNISNQGWKDSSDAIRCRDGSLPHGEIALCEVQGYAYAARLGLADLAEALASPDPNIAPNIGAAFNDSYSDSAPNPGRAAPLLDIAHDQRAAAATARERFNHDFWLPDRDFFAQALAGSGPDKSPVDSLTSNPGQLLWTAIADQDRARAIADRFLTPEFFSGWGIRTTAASEAAYNPVSYQSGSVWPHDNSLIAAGLARYGHIGHAERVIEGLLDALRHAADRRLPELFTGLSTEDASEPVQYPMACRPQAWATGAVFLLISTMIGLDPAVGPRGVSGAPENRDATPTHDDLQRLFPGEPLLPPSINHLRIDGLFLQGRRISVTLTRAARGVDRHLL